MLVSKFPSNHHNLDGLDFLGIKKKHDPFMAIYRTNHKVSVLFFPKIWTPTQKKSESTSQKKTCFGYSSILLKLVGQSRRFAHAHLLTFLAPKPESSVCDGGCCPW